MQAGFHILIPFVERIAYRHNLKEHAVDIPEQICITRDNVQVGVDGVLYMKVLDAQRARPIRILGRRKSGIAEGWGRHPDRQGRGPPSARHALSTGAAGGSGSPSWLTFSGSIREELPA